MVRLSYLDASETEEVFDRVKQSAYGHQACAVMILVAHEVDAMSACKMLTRILMFDNVAYTVRSVANAAQIRTSFQDIQQSVSIKTVFMVNCGATMDLPKELDLETGDIRCIVLDNHRPFHLKNLHSAHNVVVMDYPELIDWDEQMALVPSDDSDLESELKRFEKESDYGSSTDESDSDSDSDGEGRSVGSDVGRDDDVSEVADSVVGDGDVGAEETELFSDAEGEEAQGMESTLVDDDAGMEGDDEGDDEGNDGEGEDKEEGGEMADDEPFQNDTSREDDEEEEEEQEQLRRRKRSDVVDPVRSKRKKTRSYLRRAPFVAPPTALAMVEVASTSRQRFNQEFFWQAILGITDQYLRGNLSEVMYTKACEEVNRKLATVATNETDPNAARFQVARGGEAEGEEQQMVTVQGSEAGRVTESYEFRFFLYRHWSLYDAMYYSPYVASKLAVWKTQGSFRLKEMLAKLGMPLQECYQQYAFMSPELRKSFRDQLLVTMGADEEDEEDGAQSITNKYNMKNPGVFFRSFLRYNSFRNPVAAMDVVHAASALVELCQQDAFDEEDTTSENARLSKSGSVFSGLATHSQQDAFNAAYDCLSMKDDELKRGLAAAKALQKIVVRQAASMLGSPNALLKFPTFYYGKISLKPGAAPVGTSSGAPSSSGSGAGGAGGAEAEDEIEDPLSRPMVVSRLGHFIIEVQRENGRWIKNKAKPLVLVSERKHSWLIVGITCPANAWNPEDQPHNVCKDEGHPNPNFDGGFATQFPKAALGQKLRFRNDSLDSCVMEVSKEVDVDKYILSLIED